MRVDGDEILRVEPCHAEPVSNVEHTSGQRQLTGVTVGCNLRLNLEAFQMRWWRLAMTALLAGSLFQFCVAPARGLSANTESQTQSSSPDKLTYVVTGTVVDSVRGEGIRGALVELSGEAQDATLTDAGGKFRFEGLPSNHVILAAKKPGYFNEQDMLRWTVPVGEQNRNESPAIVREVTGPVSIKLVQEAVIFGRVLGYGNEPVESLPVVVSMFGMFDGRKTSVQIGGGTTDEDGNLRIAGLVPGSYYVAVGPGPAKVVRESGTALPSHQGYPTVFYPGASERDASELLSIGAGTRTELNFTVTPQPFYHVSGAVSGYGPGQQAHIQFVGATTLGPAGIAPCDPASGAFTSNWLPAGTYVVRVLVSGPSEFPLSASQYLTVDQNISDLRIQVQPAITIPIHVSAESTKNSPLTGRESVVAALTPKGPQGAVGGGSLIGRISSTGSIFRVEAGTYLAKLSVNPPWYVQSAMYGTQDVLREDLIVGVGGGSRSFEIAVRDDGATLNGATTTYGHPSRGAVLIVPEDAPSQLRIVATNQDGVFQVGALAPGSYRVIAFDNVDSLEFRNPTAMTDYLTKAQTVLLNANQTASVSLELIKRAN